jgi:hypothetical protein
VGDMKNSPYINELITAEASICNAIPSIRNKKIIESLEEARNNVLKAIEIICKNNKEVM